MGQFLPSHISQRPELRQRFEREAQPLAGTEGAGYPFWSPESRSVGFFAQGKLKRIDVAGGASQVLANASSGRGGTWNCDGVIVFAPTIQSPLYRISASIYEFACHEGNHAMVGILSGHRAEEKAAEEAAKKGSK